MKDEALEVFLGKPKKIFMSFNLHVQKFFEVRS